MKKQYISPTLKVVAFKMERGFADSVFRRCEDQFLMESFDEEFRAEKFNYDDWNSSAPSSDDGKFNYSDWGTL